MIIVELLQNFNDDTARDEIDDEEMLKVKINLSKSPKLRMGISFRKKNKKRSLLIQKI